MLNFTYHNPTKIIFGKGTIARLSDELNKKNVIMMLYGGGSIKKNGVYKQVTDALSGYACIEFGGIEANPLYETCMKAVACAREKKVDFILAVGGGSVIDAAKFIAAAIRFDGFDPWDILTRRAVVSGAVPIGTVLTLSATGSEMNGFSVISRREPQEKLSFGSPHVFPRFSILDPETALSLPVSQIRNGIVDPFVHVTEQYLTYPVGSPLQDRQAEALLLTLIEEGPKALANPNDYDIRATLMWCATQVLNTNIGVGVAHDWSTHYIGHELTALHGIDHAQSLAIVLPAVLRHQKERKSAKLIQYAERVWGITGTDAQKRDGAIDKTRAFFKSVGMPVSFADAGIPHETARIVAKRIGARGELLGEHQAIGEKQIEEILLLCLN